MKKHFLILAFTLVFVIAGENIKAQLFDFKSWKGTYPEMNGYYPMAFIAFKGNLIPIPHEFIRLWPTHYYYEVVSVPTYDIGDYASELKVSFLRIAAKLLEKSQMEKRHSETEQIKNNTEIQRDIEKKIFDAEFDQLPDVYRIAAGFIRLYDAIVRLERLNKVGDCTWLVQMYRKEADELLARFITVNLFQTGHGKKLEAFAEIQTELNSQIGEADYTYRKVHHYLVYTNDPNLSYTFLTH
jgi:hypothetical protein